MKKYIVGIGLLFAGACAVLMSLAPDTLSMLVIAVMCLVVAMGFILGMTPTLLYDGGFREGMRSISHIHDVHTTETWVAVDQIEYFFRQKTLDQLFQNYKQKMRKQQEEDLVVSDIEEIINEEALSLRSWQAVMHQIPGTLTGLGILGTFLGLITGISGIGFSSVEATISSITVLLGGIRTAFYTSVVGVVLSILFNIIYKFVWNSMVRSMGLFMEEFHLQIQPDADEQMRIRQVEDMKTVIDRLDRLPKTKEFNLASAGGTFVTDDASEQQMMPEIRQSLQNGDFIFYLQPKYDLNSKQMIGAEALMRWNHPELGVLLPAMFLPIVEQNGYITKLDQMIWESACKTIRSWIDADRRPVPIAVNVSKTDILAIDVAKFFDDMIHKYQIPPRYLEIEITQGAYVKSTSATLETESKLRQSGFRVLVDGFAGDFMTLYTMEKSQADAVKLNLRYMDQKDGIAAIQEVYAEARKLRMAITTVGIENAEQLGVLKRSGCSEGQGDYLQQPMCIEEFTDLLQ